MLITNLIFTKLEQIRWLIDANKCFTDIEVTEILSRIWSYVVVVVSAFVMIRKTVKVLNSQI